MHECSPDYSLPTNDAIILLCDLGMDVIDVCFLLVYSGNATQFAECNTVPCPVDGVMSEWGNWGLCEESVADCAKGTRRRRKKCIQPRHNGNPCLKQITEEPEDCELDPSCHGRLICIISLIAYN